METNQTLIFIVEDDPTFNKLLTSFLSTKNIGIIKSFLSGEECLDHISEKPDIILMDYDLPLKNGLETLEEVQKLSPKTKCIFLSGQSNVKVGVDSIKKGAVDYIVKDMYAKENALYKIIEVKNTLIDKNIKSDDRSDTTFYY
jgi:two-component system, NtrC family, response regulator AtoC